MRFRQLFLTLIAVSMSHCSVSAAATVEGTWQPRAIPADANMRIEASPPDFASAWQITRESIHLTMPAKTRAAYSIVRREPLPAEDWTLDLVVIQHDEFVPARFMFSIGSADEGGFQLRVEPSLDYAGIQARGRGKWSGENVRSAAGPLHWVRLVYDSTAKRLEPYLNGVPLLLREATAPVAMPQAPISLLFYTASAHEKPVALEVGAFMVRPEALREPDSVAGLAFAGWPQSGQSKWTPAVRERLNARLKAILDSPETDGVTRASAMAARVLSERAATGKLSDASWEGFVDLLTTANDLNLDALSRLLPLAIAAGDVTGNPARRAKAELWTQRLFEALPSPHQNRDVTPVLQRAALLDPARTSIAIAGRRVSLPFARALGNDLQAEAPIKGFAAFRTFDRPFPDAEAWMLPESSTLAPLWSEVVMKRLRVFATQKAFVSGQPDRALATAAYRLASTQPAIALEFAGQIQSPDTKAEALEAVAGVLPQKAGRELDASIEAALRAAIAAWNPTARDDSCVPQRIRLAQWLFARDRVAEARKELDEASTNIGKLATTKFRDTWAIARAARDMKAPDARLWLDQAAIAATERDTNADEFGSRLYLSATILVVGELVKSGQIDDALALTRKLDRELLDDNFNLALSRIIFALLKNDAKRNLPQALKLSEELSPGHQRSTVMVSLAAQLAAADMSKALQIFEQLPEDKQVNAAFRMLGSAPPSQSAKLRELAGKAIASHLREWKTAKRHDTHSKLLSNLTELPVGALLDLETYFEEDRALFTASVLSAVVRDAGWESTPLWKRYIAADNINGWSVPWGLGRLRDSIRAEESNRERGLE